MPPASPALLLRAAALVATVPLAACGTSAAGTLPSDPASVRSSTAWHGSVLPAPAPKPSAALADTDGVAFRIDRDARQPVVLLAFGYTHCAVTCSQVLRDLAAALRPLDPGTRHRIEVLFVTTDPERDTGPVLAGYLQGFDPTFVGLRGTESMVRGVAAGVGVAVTGRVAVQGGYSVGHGAQVVAFGPDGLAHLMFMPGTPVADLRADLVRLALTP